MKNETGTLKRAMNDGLKMFIIVLMTNHMTKMAPLLRIYNFLLINDINYSDSRQMLYS